jgi:hypothetical protein
VDENSYAYSGVTVVNTLFSVNESCPLELFSGAGVLYPAVNGSCLVSYFTDTSGAPFTPPFTQLPYNVRTTTWYEKQRATLNPSAYGTFLEPVYGKQGVSVSVPVLYNGAFSGAVQVFMQTVILSESAAAGDVNISYLMTADRFLVGTSEVPIALLDVDGQPVSAVNYSNPVIAASAQYIADNAISTKNVFFHPLSPGVTMEIVVAPVVWTPQLIDNWLAVSVTLFDTSAAPAPVLAPSHAPTLSPSSSNSDSSSRELEVAAISVGSIGLVGLIAVMAAIGLWGFAPFRGAAGTSSAAAGSAGAGTGVSAGAGAGGRAPNEVELGTIGSSDATGGAHKTENPMIRPNLR